MQHHQLQEILKKLRDFLEKTYNERLCQVLLYGSQARREATSSSDIDILIILNQPINYRLEIARTSQFIAELSLEYNTVISRAFVEETRFKTEQNPFLMNVRREAIAV